MALDFIQDNETVIVELDMKFNASVWRKIQEANEHFLTGNSYRNKRKAINYMSLRWTNRTVPYELAQETFNSYNKRQMDAAISDLEYYTCLDFKERTSERNYIYLQNGRGCSSYVGMNGGLQAVTLAPGCRTKGVIIHELGHAIGFQHEQTRPDRNDHVEILFENIQKGVEYNFQRYSKRVVNDYDVPYDYESIMHYGQYAFSSNQQPTIRTLDPSKQNVIGNRHGLSFRDIKLANLMYECNTHCGNKKCPDEGFMNKDCSCWCPGDPIKACNGDDGGIETECEDENNNCGTWAANSECKSNPDYMLEHCKRSCHVCNNHEHGGTDENTDENCYDTSEHCERWAESGFCNNFYYKQYMTENCKESCNMCINESCEDTTLTCLTWKQSDFCQNPRYRTFMNLHCKKTCEFCIADDDTNCSDGDANCSYWESIGECDKNPAYMHANCKRSCGKC